METIAINTAALTSRQPKLCERILLVNAKGECGTGSLVATGRRVDGYKLREYQIDKSIAMSHESPVVAWAPYPANDDPRWTVTHEMGGAKVGEFYLTGGQCSDAPEKPWCSFTTCSFKELPFPGFMNGPMRRNEGVKRFMPAADAFAVAYTFPEELFEGDDYFELVERLEREYQEAFVDTAVMTMTSDGAIYRRNFSALVDGQSITSNRFRCTLQHWADPASDARGKDRANALLCWCMEVVRRWENDSAELLLDLGRSYSNRETARKEAAKALLDYYTDLAGVKVAPRAA